MIKTQLSNQLHAGQTKVLIGISLKRKIDPKQIKQTIHIYIYIYIYIYSFVIKLIFKVVSFLVGVDSVPSVRFFRTNRNRTEKFG
jgi:hypothetical protein